MFGISSSNKWIRLMVLLIVANIAYYFYNNWGLVTVKVTNAPLGKVISSIEWQGWVKIYTNLPLDTKVTMYVDHVPLAEAMETLAANVDVPPPSLGSDDGARPNGDRPARSGNRPGGGGFFGGAGGGGPGGPQDGRGGGFGRRAEWNLAFFVAPTSAQVKQEIREFQSSDPDDDNKVYTYGTQLQLIASDSTTTAPDPRLQSWPGVKPVDPSASPAQAPPAAPVDAQASAATPTQTGSGPADPPANTPPTIQTYLEAFAESANIWIMAPSSWAPEVSSAPPPNSSIIRAVENFVSGSHGAVTEALVLRAGRGGTRGGRGDFGNDDAWADRMRNAINGLPPDERPDALDQLNTEVQFRKDLRALPPEQRRQKMFQHMAERMIYGERLSRLSPAKRALIYQRMIAMREAAKAQK
jgi:hypothetical protein